MASPTESPSKASCSGSSPCLRTQDGIREVGLQGRFAARLARSQHVEADPPDDRRQPGPQVVDIARVGAAQADPGFLDGVVRLGHGAEHPIGDAAQVGAVCLEALGEPVLVVHRSRSCGWSGHVIDPRARVNVTDAAYDQNEIGFGSAAP